MKEESYHEEIQRWAEHMAKESMNWNQMDDPKDPKSQKRYREGIQRRAEHIAEMHREGASDAVIHVMTRFWAKLDEVRGFKVRP